MPKLEDRVVHGSLKDGWLKKQGGQKNNKGWKKRYIVVQDNVIYYFADEYDPTSKGSILVNDIVKAKWGEDPKHPFAFAIETPGRKYLMLTDAEKDMNEWIDAINVIAELHKLKTNYLRVDLLASRCRVADEFKSAIINLSDQIVTSCIKLSAMFKNQAMRAAVANKKKGEEKKDLSARGAFAGQLAAMQSAAVQLASASLNALKKPFDEASTKAMWESGKFLRSILVHLKSFATGTPNEAATVYNVDAMMKTIDVIDQIQLPNQKTECKRATQALVEILGRMIEAGEVPSNEMAQIAMTAADDYSASTQELAALIPDATLRGNIILRAQQVPPLMREVLNLIKSTTWFKMGEEARKLEAHKEALREPLVMINGCVKKAYPKKKKVATGTAAAAAAAAAAPAAKTTSELEIQVSASAGQYRAKRADSDELRALQIK